MAGGRAQRLPVVEGGVHVGQACSVPSDPGTPPANHLNRDEATGRRECSWQCIPPREVLCTHEKGESWKPSASGHTVRVPNSTDKMLLVVAI